MRFLDVIFFIYFLTHIPIALLVDFQGLFGDFYPSQLVALKDWYCQEFRDPMMKAPPAWYTAMVICEMCQFPFFFVATYGFFKGAKKCKWLRLPSIIYGTHVATTLVPIITHVLLHDFSKEKLPGPRNMNDRLKLVSIYSPYFIIPVVLVLDALFSSAYTAQAPSQQQPQHQRSKKNR